MFGTRIGGASLLRGDAYLLTLVPAQGSVRIELRGVKPLISCSVAREPGMVLGIHHQAVLRRKILGECRLSEDQSPARCNVGAVNCALMTATFDTRAPVRPMVRRSLRGLDRDRG